MFFEARKKQDTFLWLSPSPEEGPSIRFLVENIHTLAELRFTGNCLAKSRPVLSFHADFDSKPEWKIVRSALEKVFNVPRYHPKSQPFIDHIFNFSILDGKIWFRNYQLVPVTDTDLVEIGPRFTLTPLAIFAGSLIGEKIWKNNASMTPNEQRRMLRLMRQGKKPDPVARAQAKLAKDMAVEGLEKYNDERREEIFK